MLTILFCFFIALLITFTICLVFRVFPDLFVILEKGLTYFCNLLAKIAGIK